jgi:hypothetical protein
VALRALSTEALGGIIGYDAFKKTLLGGFRYSQKTLGNISNLLQ